MLLHVTFFCSSRGPPSDCLAQPICPATSFLFCMSCGSTPPGHTPAQIHQETRRESLPLPAVIHLWVRLNAKSFLKILKLPIKARVRGTFARCALELCLHGTWRIQKPVRSSIQTRHRRTSFGISDRTMSTHMTAKERCISGKCCVFYLSAGLPLRFCLDSAMIPDESIH